MKHYLAHGCSCSQISVFPKNWEQKNASIKKKWYIHYRFYDPTNPSNKGYLKIIKRMNKYNTLAERQRVTRDLIDNELHLLKEREYNPITGAYIDTDKPDYIIDPETGLCAALTKALELLDGVQSFKDDIESNLRYLIPAAQQLRIAHTPVKDIRRRHMLMLLEQCGKNKDVWTAATYNRYRRNLGSLFRVLVKVEAIEHTPIDRYLEQKKPTQKLKEVLSPEQVKMINTHLRKNNYKFWRFVHIFCNSGARTTEIMRVQVRDVDMVRQMVKYTIKKGKAIREVERPIKNDVLYLWEQLMVEAKDLGPDAYLFSAALSPGLRPIREDQIRHRWRLWVQQDPDTRQSFKSGRKTVHPRISGLGIKVPWYRLKHLNTDLLDTLYGSSIPAQLNQHDQKMVTDVYAVSNKARMNEVIKQSPNPLTYFEN